MIDYTLIYRLRSMNVLYVIDDVAVWMRSNRLQLNPKIRPRSSGLPRVAVSVNCPNHTPLRVGFDYVAPVFVTLGSISIRTSTWGHAFLRLFRPVSRYYASFTVSVGYTRQIRSPVTDVITRPVTTGLLQHSPGWYSVVTASTAPVGHELCRTTSVVLRSNVRIVKY